MANKTAPLLPPTAELLRQFGDRLRLARRRRRLSAKQVAERAGMSPMTLRSLERGGSGVTMGAYLAVMQVLGIESDLDLLATADPLGRALQDARLRTDAKTTARSGAGSPAPVARPEHVSRVGDAVTHVHRGIDSALESLPREQLRKALAALPSEQLRPTLEALDAPSEEMKKLLRSTKKQQTLRDQGGFVDSETLAALIDPFTSLPTKRH